MSDTLECFGVEYTNVAGFKATDDNDNVLTYIRPQGNKAITANGTDIDVAAFATASVAVPESTFVITVAFSTTSDLWECNKTYSEIQTAYNAGKTIVVVASPAESVSADGAWNANGSYFDYWVRIYVDTVPPKIREQNYRLTSNGYVLNDDVFYITTPTGTVNITQAGNTDVTNYATASVAAQTLPTSASASATSGYTSKATIGRSTSDQYINIPTGYNNAGAYYKVSAVANGTAGTPTATKGTVSNHQVTVTPTVTNTTGYITGTTKTGTGVTVTASELASGNKEITSNGTNIDVVGYSTVSVNVSGGATYTATITRTGNSSYVYVTHNNTKYYTSGNTFTYHAGDTLTCYAASTQAVYTSYVEVDGTRVATGSTQATNYSYTLPAYDVSLDLVYNTSSPHVSITQPTLAITANGQYDVANYAVATVNVAAPSSSNCQTTTAIGRVAATSYTDSGVTLTVAKTGTYTVVWSGYRSSTSGTSGTQLYKNGAAYGSANTTFDSTYTNCQTTKLTGVSLTQNDVLVVRARSRSTSYYMYVLGMTIYEE